MDNIVNIMSNPTDIWTKHYVHVDYFYANRWRKIAINTEGREGTTIVHIPKNAMGVLLVPNNGKVTIQRLELLQ